MDLEEFLERAEQNRRVQRAFPQNRTLSELYAEFAQSTMPFKITVMEDRVFVAVDGLARALGSY
jgi:hypothetical protein